MAKKLKPLLDKFRRLQAAELKAEDGAPQVLSPAEPIPKGIPTLERGVYRPATPQLVERFDYAARWRNAWLYHVWLSVADMEAAWDDNDIQKQVNRTRRDWEGSVVAEHEPGCVTLFGLNQEEGSETYLLWQSDKEPSVHVYEDPPEQGYRSLVDFLNQIITAYK